MKLESLSFTAADYDEVVEDYFERERGDLLDRLERVPDAVESLIPLLEERRESGHDGWNAHETLAHMAIAGQFFAGLVHMIVENQDVGDPIEAMKLRDVAIADAVEMGPSVLALQLRDSIERTLKFLRSVPYDDLRKGIQFGSRQMTAEDFVRISLCHHLEDHVDQMRQALGVPA
jgi:hypothetical protein